MVNSIINKFGKCLGVEGTFASWFVLIGIITQLLTCYIGAMPEFISKSDLSL